MDANYWLGRWERGETGWHQAEVEPALIAQFSDLPPTRILVPLCGKTLDLFWLASRGHEVIGVELSELAVRECFKQHQIDAREERVGEFIRFQGGGMTIYNGDFFKLTPEVLGTVGAVYDRAALIALPRELRARYAAHMIELLKESSKAPAFRFLQLLLERTPHDEQGPPHSVLASELSELYGRRFKITPLSREAVGESPSGARMEECVFLLTTL